MNPIWNAAEALLALVTDCLDDNCRDYPRTYIDTAQPVAECNTIAIVVGNGSAFGGSCIGQIQMNSFLDVVLIRCCDPVGTLSEGGGYTPPTPEQIQAAAACLARDVWALYECLICSLCEVLGTLPGVTACCDNSRNTVAAPSIHWGGPQGGCRSATIRIPLVFTACCPTPPTP